MGRSKDKLINHPRYGLVLQWVKECQRAARTYGWPGLPVGQIPVVCSPYLHAGINDGMMVRISRPARVNPQHTREFIALTEQGEREWATLVELGPSEFAARYQGQPVEGLTNEQMMALYRDAV